MKTGFSGNTFIAGILMTAAFLMNPSVPLRTAQFLLFTAYALLMGKKINVLTGVLMMSCVIFFNLLVPSGKILAEIGGFPVTQGSLLGGIRRAVTMEGLIMLSKASVSADLRLPGSFGSLLGESLRIFQRILDWKKRIVRSRFIEGIDEMLIALSGEQETQAECTPSRSKPLGALLLGGACLPVFALTGIGLILA
ncbi:MAG: hypothetical protein LBG87_08185 [Spirochaetaceae bacterium]|jgi:heptaprenyl diphosphate synthase|nr:hypothetical protein [Spirochaetaceae bacterium]